MPVFFSKIFISKRLSKVDPDLLKSVRLVCSSGGKVTHKMLDHISAHFKNADFYSMYGLTEAFRSTYLDPKELKLRPDSIGKAIPDVEIFVIDVII